MAEASGAASSVASGKVTAVRDGMVVFNPAGTRYELQLAGQYAGPLNVPVRCSIRAQARKVYTVPSGGNFITPIFGPPRIVQGRVVSAEPGKLLIQAGCPVHVELPSADAGIDLDDGPIYAGRMVNVVCLPGVRGEFGG
ncbi:MAG TPA: hypothetical protein VN541_07585 [Tepidisphaeraceae bacterium]|nr:hypothetical protein [Tepidisphaeraceae bacterium]